MFWEKGSEECIHQWDVPRSAVDPSVDDVSPPPPPPRLLVAESSSSSCPIMASSATSSADWIKDCKSCTDCEARRFVGAPWLANKTLPLFSTRRCCKIPDNRWDTKELVAEDKLDKEVLR